MSHPAYHILTRCIRQSTRPASTSTFVSSRPFTTTVQRYDERPPSLADITSTGAASFDAKQQRFREKLAAARQQADSGSRGFPSAFDSTLSSSNSLSSLLNDNAGLESEKVGLGSLSTAKTEEAHEASAKAHEDAAGGRKKGALSSLIYGTPEGRKMDHDIERSFSQTLARGKYVHSIVFHDVKPDKVDEYAKLVGWWYPKVASMPENKVNLVGSWRTEVGDCDTFVHIWEYQRYHGYHESLHNIQSHPEFADFDHKLKSMIRTKRLSLMQEFSFWPTTPPRQLGGIFELRSYTLHPGNLLEWETHWRKGLKARREVMEGVGAWFVQIGDLNTVHHLWQFADLEERKARREKSWSIEGWGDTVHKTVPLIQTMKSRILVPMSWSPVA